MPQSESHKTRDQYEITTASPILQQVFAGMDRSAEKKAAKAAGIGYTSVWAWRRGMRAPMLFQLEAFLQVLGYRLKLERIEE